MISAVLFLSFFVFLILNVPIAICLGLSSVCAILYSGTSLTIVATNMYSGISKFLLLAIPFFVLSGNIMAKAGISKRLIKFVNTCVGHRRGGIAIVCVIVACFFGAISGSGPATVAALGAVLIPAMVEEGGFSAPFSTAMMATSSSIAIVIPPSIAFVVYASITGVSIADMFAGGIIPGVLMGLALIVVIMIEVRKKGIQPTTKKASWGERGKAFADAFWGFLMPIIILGGIYGGIFTPTEAGAFAVVYALIICTFYYKEFSFKDIGSVLVSSAASTATIMFIVAGATAASIYFTLAQIPAAMANLLGGLIEHPTLLMLLINIFLLCMGMIMDCTPNILIFAPVLFPIIKKAGIDPYYFACLMNFNLCIGLITPPVGVVLYVAMDASKDGEKLSVGPVVKHLLPFLAVEFGLLFLMIFVPQLITVPLKWLT